MDDSFSSTPTPSAPQLRFGKIDDLASRVAAAIDGCRKRLFSQQHEDGYWCGELEADTTLESDYILLHAVHCNVTISLGMISSHRAVSCSPLASSQQPAASSQQRPY